MSLIKNGNKIYQHKAIKKLIQLGQQTGVYQKLYYTELIRYAVL